MFGSSLQSCLFIAGFVAEPSRLRATSQSTLARSKRERLMIAAWFQTQSEDEKSLVESEGLISTVLLIYRVRCQTQNGANQDKKKQQKEKTDSVRLNYVRYKIR